MQRWDPQEGDLTEAALRGLRVMLPNRPLRSPVTPAVFVFLALSGGCKPHVAATAAPAESRTVPSTPSTPPAGGTIAGRVTWYEDGQSAAGVPVLIFGVDPPGLPRHTRTDQSGHYRVDGLAPGEYAVEARLVLPKELEQRPDAGRDVFVQFVVPRKELRVVVAARGSVQHDLRLYKPAD